MLNVCWKEIILLNMTSFIVGGIWLSISLLELFLLAENIPVILDKEVHIPLKPVEKSLSDYEEDILCVL